ncbi:MAG: hypothetical protein ACI4MQ_04775 [Candidatus Coproplasma sp.]
MKKLIIFLTSLLMCFSLFTGCAQTPDKSPDTGDGDVTDTPDDGKLDPKPEPDWLDATTDSIKTNLSADGYVRGNISDFSIYEGTAAYRTVTNADELTAAIKDAIWHYKTVWNESDNTITQMPADGYTEENFKGTVHVIEITQDIDLGYNVLSETAKSSGVIENNIKNATVNDADGNNVPAYTMSSMYEEHGMSTLKIQNTNDLLIYSKTGAKITHATMNVMAVSNVVFRNLEFDEVWQWEDSQSNMASKVGDYDSQKWAYFKINFCGYVWIDHCTFGKAFDGLIDYANPVYSETQAMANVNRAPYGLVDERGVHISWCSFNGGSDDKDGYIYKMMQEIEQNYQANLADASVKCKYLYYKALRDEGASFDDILYGLAIPQKKAFLCGDAGNNDNDYRWNRKLKISIANCYFKNIEDRIPKLRGGNCYFYNNVVDNFKYFEYRNKLSSYASSVSQLGGNSSSWKCALTSQCLLVSNGASLRAENCIFRGINTLIKNNDKAITVDGDSTASRGYYQLINCIYQLNATSGSISGSTTDVNNPFTASGSAYTDGFSWHATGGNLPFDICPIIVLKLEAQLFNENYGVGVRAAMGEKCLKSNY